LDTLGLWSVVGKPSQCIGMEMRPIDTEAVVPRLAVSVLMLRRDAPELEVFIQHRVSTMDFAPGAVVFPGGRVDNADYVAGAAGVLEEAVLERHVDAWRQTAAGSNGEESLLELSAVLLAAAIREVGEETGAAITASELIPWANWVTPPGGPKRFDTYFYLAIVGPSVVPRHQTTEANASHWWPVRKVLDEAAAGNLQLLRPTYELLKDLASFDDIQDIVDSGRPINPR
jgi:8-oxo-dGTP pyrophosphatase MutT (NUDIX family)